MARIFVDGFESGGLDLWDITSSAQMYTPQTGMTGTYCAGANAAAGYIEKILPSNKTELYISFKINYGSNLNGFLPAFKDSASAVIASLTRNTTSTFMEFRLGTDAATVQATGTIPIVLSTTYLIEIRYKPLNSGGVLTTKINGVQDINFSGDSTAGLENISSIRFGRTSGASSNTITIDDVVFDDANWIGNTKIQAIVPTGAGATTGWTPSTGNNWDAVNEKPVSDTDYIKTSSGQIDTYAMGNLTGSIASIKSVAVQTRNWREGNGSYDRGQHIVRPASTDRLAASKTSIFPISATSFQSIWELNPEDSAAWEEADVNGMEAGIKAVTA